uniref:Ribonuclease H-like domain-containing protein n=1 Tax=Tanacetum cinerariifolium TaxID=118510 RepID=A0A6L2MXR0_TANCI|nr:ribonuclease H-like domain-containing protein [Tanacetum cinerariifolium]
MASVGGGVGEIEVADTSDVDSRNGGSESRSHGDALYQHTYDMQQFTRDNNCTVDFDAFGFLVKDFLTRHILLRCDSSGDLYPVTSPSLTPPALLSVSSREPHLAALKRVFRYIRGTLDHGLQLHVSSTPQLNAYTDADWVGCPVTRRSTSGYCVFFGDNLLSWSAKRQVTLSRSSAEAEYRRVTNVVAETAWIRNLLRELHNPLFTATLVYCDNVSAVYTSSNLVQHQRTKHIEIDIHFVRDMVARGQVRVLHVPTRYQYVEIFTKGLPTALFEEFYTSLSVRSSPAQTAGHSILPTLHRPLHIHNVLVTANIIKNLIYVRQFTRDNNCTIEFDAFGFSVKNFLTRHILLGCHSLGDLYPVTQPSSLLSVMMSLSYSTWHQRLGHPGDELLRSFVSRNLISRNKEKSHHVCYACQLGKHVKLPFSISTSIVSSCFVIIHSDIWTSSIVSTGGFKYYVIFLDHFSHYLWIYPLRTQSKVLLSLHTFVHLNVTFLVFNVIMVLDVKNAFLNGDMSDMHQPPDLLLMLQELDILPVDVIHVYLFTGFLKACYSGAIARGVASTLRNRPRRRLEARKHCNRIVSDKGNDQGLENQSNTFGDESSGSRNECYDKSTSGDDTNIRPSYDTEPMIEVPYTAEYNVFVVDTQHSEPPKCIINTCLVEKVDSNVIPDSPDMCDNEIQTDQNALECDDERVALANLIENLKLDVDENKKIQKQLKKANISLAHELKECKSILA